MKNSFKTADHLSIQGTSYEFFNLNKLPTHYDVHRLPFSLKILLENLLRCEDGISVREEDIHALLQWDPKKRSSTEIAFTPSRVILQDFTGVPAIVDLAAMRDAMKKLGKNPDKINPLSPVELVIDHSVIVDYFGDDNAYTKNTAIEIQRNYERYRFLRWGQAAFSNFKVVPPGTGIVHQVNIEYLARVIFSKKNSHGLQAYPDTLVGTDSHTPMVNGLGVLGWGVGGIEAEAAMLGQPITMLIPEVIGVELTGTLNAGATATDLVLTITEILRKKGVVGKFVEFFGEGLDTLPLADRATIGNMAPEYGATVGIFPIDKETLNYLAFTGRDSAQCALVNTYSQHQGLFREKNARRADYSETLQLDLREVVPSIAGPRRPQDKIALKDVKRAYNATLQTLLSERHDTHDDDISVNEGANILEEGITYKVNGHEVPLDHGAVVIAAITSCTNTSNPAVMIAAGLIAKAAQARGLKPKPWVKTSFAPGSQVVTDYMEHAGLMAPLNALGFNLVGYGCTTCIGNSGPLPEKVTKAINHGHLAVSAVLSGNRNFEGRIHPQVQHAFLASPPLVVIYALTGTMNIDLYNEPVGHDKNNAPVYLKDLWPTNEVIQSVLNNDLTPDMFASRYAHVYQGDEQWRALDVALTQLYEWKADSTYIKHPPYFERMSLDVPAINDIQHARVLVHVGDSVTTDHISPAGAIAHDSPAGSYLLQQNIPIRDFNSYGSRRGNHEVMVRGTFANIRLKNFLANGKLGSWTQHQPSNDIISIYDAAMRYAQDNIPLIVLAGKEYGSGSSRDWAAKGPYLLGIRAVIAQSYERIHRSNLIGMGIIPLQFLPNENAESLGLTGRERFSLSLQNLTPQGQISVIATDDTNQSTTFMVTVRIDAPKELEYYQHGGILHYVLRQLAKQS